MPDIETVFEQLGNMLDTRPGIRDSYEQRVATKPKVLDIGGRNHTSNSARRLRLLGAGTSTRIIATDVIPDYGPDLLDDITNTTIQPNSFDGIYCDAVLEHVTDYQMAISNIHSILRPGGEAFLYVPFFFQFHDKMDYHRFTISELARMVSGFSEAKIFVPGNGTDVGYGWVLWDVITYGKIRMLPRLHSALASIVNRALELTVRVWYRRKARPFTLDQAIFFAVNLNYNHGFCAWVRK